MEQVPAQSQSMTSPATASATRRTGRSALCGAVRRLPSPQVILISLGTAVAVVVPTGLALVVLAFVVLVVLVLVVGIVVLAVAMWSLL